MRWKSTITEKGLNILANLNNKPILVTRAKTSSKTVKLNELKTMTDVTCEEKELSITSNDTDGNIHRLQLQMTSSGVDKNFYIKQIGIFVKVGDEEETLFMIYQVENPEDEGDIVPSFEESPHFISTYWSYLTFENASEVNINFDNKAYMTVGELNEKFDKRPPFFVSENEPTNGGTEFLWADVSNKPVDTSIDKENAHLYYYKDGVKKFLSINDTNADTVDGKHASDFAPSGFGLGTYSQPVSGDWNKYMATGFYHGHHMKNQPPTPDDSTNAWFVMAIKFTDDRWCTQIAFNFEDPNTNYIRRKINNTWSQWEKIGNGAIAETISSILPVNKGGTGAANVVDALKNLKLLNNDLPNNTPASSALVYKNYSDFGLESMNMFGFSKNPMSDYSSIIFHTSKTHSSYITDIPSNDGIVMFFRSGLNHKAALFFSTDGNDRGSIYHWSANSQVLHQNWKKINDSGNADTVDGKHASDFIGNGPCEILYGDLNEHCNKTGFFMAKNILNHPPTPPELAQNGDSHWNIIILAHSNDKWCTQIATYYPNHKYVYIRKKMENVWSEWVKLNDGGNADTVDGKHASDFAPNGFGLGTFSHPSSGDWNKYMTTGFYHGRNLQNQPPTPSGANGLWFVMAIKYSDDRWCTQIAFNFDNLSTNYIRKKVNNTWSQWEKLGNGAIAETISSILPVDKGGTGAADVLNALKNLKLLNNSFSNAPAASALVYKNYSDFGLPSMNTFDFCARTPNHSVLVFETFRSSSSPCITDAPSGAGTMVVFRGNEHGKYVLYFSNQSHRHSIHKWSSNATNVIEGWKEISDGGNANTVDGKHANEFATAAQGTKADNALPASTYTASDILNKLKTVDGTNSGLDADLLDGKHASDFAPSGFGLGTHSQPVTGDWNNCLNTGFYHGNNLLNQPPTPDGINSYWYVIAIKFIHDGWCTQIAFNFQIPGMNYVRRRVNNVWSQWEKLGNGAIAETISSILPVDKGGTGAADVLNALKNLKLLNNSFSNAPAASALVYKNYSDFGLPSMNTFDFCARTPNHSVLVFETFRSSSSPCITDAPSGAGTMVVFRGNEHGKYALYFSNQSNRHSIHKWSSNATNVIEGWKEISDGGNANTVDGKHANEFATAAQGTKADNALPASTYTASDILNKLKTVDGTNSGLDADLLDGKHASDFAPNGFGLGTFSHPSSGDWNKYMTTGFYHGRNLQNQPPTPSGANGLWFVMAIKYSDDRWCTQIAFNFDNLSTNYIRKKVNNTWSQWEKLGNGAIAETISSILPVNKGGTGAANVVDALKNLKLLNNDLPNNTPASSALVYKNYSDFGLESMNMFGFSKNPMSDYSSIIFHTSKTHSSYITDIPSNDGIVMFFRSGLNHKAALFFSTDGNDRGSIYHWSANSQVLHQNWKKINDGGNADTLDGKHASDFVLKSDLNKPKGINLLLTKYLNSNTIRVQSNSGYGFYLGNNTQIHEAYKIPLEKDKTYALSFTAWSEKGQDIYIDFNENREGQYYNSVGTKPGIYKHSFTPRTSGIYTIRLTNLFATSYSPTYFTDIKLEEGTATDWTAPVGPV